MRKPLFLIRPAALVLSGVLLATNCLFAHRVEANIWSDRQKASMQARKAFQVAQLPLNPIPQLPVVSRAVSASVPASFSGKLGSLAPLLPYLPAAYGAVRKVVVPETNKNGKIVIHIQDVHRNAEAQRNIGLAVQSLIRGKQADVLALEGAFAPINLTPFHPFAGSESLRRVADYLLRENKISGPVHGAMVSAPVSTLVGIDDKIHYDANVDAYRKSARRLADVRERIAVLKQSTEAEKGAKLNSELKRFDDLSTGYHEGKLPLGDYLARAFGRPDFSSTAIDAFRNAFQLESVLDFSRVEKERGELLSELLAKMGKAGVNELLQTSVAYRAEKIRHADFYAYLQSVCDREGIRWSKGTALNDYFRYVRLTEQIDPETLFSDIQKAERRTYESLIKNSVERDLIARSKKISLTGKLIEFSLTKNEWDEYKEVRSAEYEVRGEESHLDISSFEDFYREAETRDRKMAENVMASFKPEMRNAVLVTGGFHSAGIGRRLLAEGYTVVTFVPKITRVDAESGSAYLSVFAQEKTSLEKLFQGEKLFLADQPASRAVLVDAVGGVGAAETIAGIKENDVLAWIGNALKTYGVELVGRSQITVEAADIVLSYVIRWNGSERRIVQRVEIGTGDSIQSIQSTVEKSVKDRLDALREAVGRPLEAVGGILLILKRPIQRLTGLRSNFYDGVFSGLIENPLLGLILYAVTGQIFFGTGALWWIWGSFAAVHLTNFLFKNFRASKTSAILNLSSAALIAGLNIAFGLSPWDWRSIVLHVAVNLLMALLATFLFPPLRTQKSLEQFLETASELEKTYMDAVSAAAGEEEVGPAALNLTAVHSAYEALHDYVRRHRSWWGRTNVFQRALRDFQERLERNHGPVLSTLLIISDLHGVAGFIGHLRAWRAWRGWQAPGGVEEMRRQLRATKENIRRLKDGEERSVEIEIYDRIKGDLDRQIKLRLFQLQSDMGSVELSLNKSLKEEPEIARILNSEMTEAAWEEFKVKAIARYFAKHAYDSDFDDNAMGRGFWAAVLSKSEKVQAELAARMNGRWGGLAGLARLRAIKQGMVGFIGAVALAWALVNPQFSAAPKAPEERPVPGFVEKKKDNAPLQKGVLPAPRPDDVERLPMPRRTDDDLESDIKNAVKSDPAPKQDSAEVKKAKKEIKKAEADLKKEGDRVKETQDAVKKLERKKEELQKAIEKTWEEEFAPKKTEPKEPPKKIDEKAVRPPEKKERPQVDQKAPKPKPVVKDGVQVLSGWSAWSTRDRVVGGILFVLAFAFILVRVLVKSKGRLRFALSTAILFTFLYVASFLEKPVPNQGSGAAPGGTQVAGGKVAFNLGPKKEGNNNLLAKVNGPHDGYLSMGAYQTLDENGRYSADETQWQAWPLSLSIPRAGFVEMRCDTPDFYPLVPTGDYLTSIEVVGHPEIRAVARYRGYHRWKVEFFNGKNEKVFVRGLVHVGYRRMTPQGELGELKRTDYQGPPRLPAWLKTKIDDLRRRNAPAHERWNLIKEVLGGLTYDRLVREPEGVDWVTHAFDVKRVSCTGSACLTALLASREYLDIPVTLFRGNIIEGNVADLAEDHLALLHRNPVTGRDSVFESTFYLKTDRRGGVSPAPQAVQGQEPAPWKEPAPAPPAPNPAREKRKELEAQQRKLDDERWALQEQARARQREAHAKEEKLREAAKILRQAQEAQSRQNRIERYEKRMQFWAKKLEIFRASLPEKSDAELRAEIKRATKLPELSDWDMYMAVTHYKMRQLEEIGWHAPRLKKEVWDAQQGVYAQVAVRTKTEQLKRNDFREDGKEDSGERYYEPLRENVVPVVLGTGEPGNFRMVPVEGGTRVTDTLTGTTFHLPKGHSIQEFHQGFSVVKNEKGRFYLQGKGAAGERETFKSLRAVPGVLQGGRCLFIGEDEKGFRYLGSEADYRKISGRRLAENPTVVIFQTGLWIGAEFNSKRREVEFAGSGLSSLNIKNSPYSFPPAPKNENLFNPQMDRFDLYKDNFSSMVASSLKGKMILIVPGKDGFSVTGAVSDSYKKKVYAFCANPFISDDDNWIMRAQLNDEKKNWILAGPLAAVKAQENVPYFYIGPILGDSYTGRWLVRMTKIDNRPGAHEMLDFFQGASGVDPRRMSKSLHPSNIVPIFTDRNFAGFRYDFNFASTGFMAVVAHDIGPRGDVQYAVYSSEGNDTIAFKGKPVLLDGNRYMDLQADGYFEIWQKPIPLRVTTRRLNRDGSWSAEEPRTEFEKEKEDLKLRLVQLGTIKDFFGIKNPADVDEISVVNQTSGNGTYTSGRFVVRVEYKNRSVEFLAQQEPYFLSRLNMLYGTSLTEYVWKSLRLDYRLRRKEDLKRYPAFFENIEEDAAANQKTGEFLDYLIYGGPSIVVSSHFPAEKFFEWIKDSLGGMDERFRLSHRIAICRILHTSPHEHLIVDILNKTEGWEQSLFIERLNFSASDWRRIFESHVAQKTGPMPDGLRPLVPIDFKPENRGDVEKLNALLLSLAGDERARAWKIFDMEWSKIAKALWFSKLAPQLPPGASFAEEVRIFSKQITDYVRAKHGVEEQDDLFLIPGRYPAAQQSQITQLNRLLRSYSTKPQLDYLNDRNDIDETLSRLNISQGPRDLSINGPEVRRVLQKLREAVGMPDRPFHSEYAPTANPLQPLVLSLQKGPLWRKFLGSQGKDELARWQALNEKVGEILGDNFEGDARVDSFGMILLREAKQDFLGIFYLILGAYFILSYFVSDPLRRRDRGFLFRSDPVETLWKAHPWFAGRDAEAIKRLFAEKRAGAAMTPDQIERLSFYRARLPDARGRLLVELALMTVNPVKLGWLGLTFKRLLVLIAVPIGVHLLLSDMSGIKLLILCSIELMLLVAFILRDSWRVRFRTQWNKLVARLSEKLKNPDLAGDARGEIEKELASFKGRVNQKKQAGRPFGAGDLAAVAMAVYRSPEVRVSVGKNKVSAMAQSAVSSVGLVEDEPLEWVPLQPGEIARKTRPAPASKERDGYEKLRFSKETSKKLNLFLDFSRSFNQERVDALIADLAYALIAATDPGRTVGDKGFSLGSIVIQMPLGAPVVIPVNAPATLTDGKRAALVDQVLREVKTAYDRSQENIGRTEQNQWELPFLSKEENAVFTSWAQNLFLPQQRQAAATWLQLKRLPGKTVMIGLSPSERSALMSEWQKIGFDPLVVTSENEKLKVIQPNSVVSKETSSGARARAHRFAAALATAVLFLVFFFGGGKAEAHSPQSKPQQNQVSRVLQGAPLNLNVSSLAGIADDIRSKKKMVVLVDETMVENLNGAALAALVESRNSSDVLIVSKTKAIQAKMAAALSSAFGKQAKGRAVLVPGVFGKNEFNFTVLSEALNRSFGENKQSSAGVFSDICFIAPSGFEEQLRLILANMGHAGATLVIGLSTALKALREIKKAA